MWTEHMMAKSHYSTNGHSLDMLYQNKYSVRRATVVAGGGGDLSLVTPYRLGFCQMKWAFLGLKVELYPIEYMSKT